IQRINKLRFRKPATPKAIIAKGEILYDVIDAITLFENYHSLCDDVLQSKTLGPSLPEKLVKYLKLTRKKMAQWKHVRNNLGGHLNLDVIRGICEFHNYRGVFVSNHLEADFKGVLLNMMLGKAVNETMSKSKLFVKEIDLTNPGDLNEFITLFMADWRITLDLFSKLNEFLYKIGRKEKMGTMFAGDIGIIKF
ncbi:MAG: hypothetical protein HN936_10160, partial [Bacteroidetes bacterium]|nr:hypothetical protein [Bacteroidota bacterium]